MQTRKALACIAMLVTTLSGGCGESTAPPGRPNIVIVPDTVRLGRGDSTHLTAVAIDGAGRTVPGVVLTYASSDSATIRVSGTGWVRSVGPVGSAIVTVSGQIQMETVSRPIPTFVTAIPRSITVAPADTTIAQEGQVQLRVITRDGLGDPVPNANLTYESLVPTVLSVSITGQITTTGPAGTGVVVVHAGSLADSARVTVTAVADSIAISPPGASMHVDDSLQFTATVYDRNRDVMTAAPVSWGSLNTTVATVSTSGVVRAQNVGTASIRARSSPAEAFAQVFVIDTSVVARLPMTGGALGVAVAGNVAYVTLPFANSVQRVNLTTTALANLFLVGSIPCGIVFNAAFTRAYVANQSSQNVSVINVATNAQIGTIPLHGDPLPVAISGNGGTLFVTTNVNRLFKINLASNTVVDSLALPATSHYLLTHPNDTLLYVATRDGGSVLEVNWRTMTVARTFPLGGMTQGLAISADRQELYVANESRNLVHIVTLATGDTTSVPLAGAGEGLALNADGTKLYVGLVFDGKVQVIDRVARTVIRTIVVGGVPRVVATDATRQHMLVANESGWLDILR